MKPGDVLHVVRGKHKGRIGFVIATTAYPQTEDDLARFKIYRKPHNGEVVLCDSENNKLFITRKQSTTPRLAMCTDHKQGVPNTPVISNIELFLYKNRPEYKYDSYYCGCYGWD